LIYVVHYLYPLYVTEPKAKARKKLGRKPFDEDRKRKRIGVRVSPTTFAFLNAMLPGMEESQRSIGRAIDLCVEVIKETGIDPRKDPLA
jgi:hypothetical protein